MFNLWAQIATIIAILGVGIAVGKIMQKVDSLDKKLNNGYQCKFHAGITEKLGNVEGQLSAKKD
jgi:hypothetical protein